MTDDLSRGFEGEDAEAEARTAAEDVPASETASEIVAGTEEVEALVGQAEIVLAAPDAGDVIAIQAAAGQRYVIQFDPEDALIRVQGNDLALIFENGGRIVFQGLGVLAGSDSPPTFEIAGTPISGSVLFGQAEALSQAGSGPIDFERVAAPIGPLGTGETRYSDDLGTTIDLLEPEGVIPPVELQFRLIDLEVVNPLGEAQPALTPPEDFDVNVIANTAEELPFTFAPGLLDAGAPDTVETVNVPTVFVIDEQSDTIFKINADGTNVSVAVSREEVAAATGLPIENVDLDESGVKVDAAGNLFFTTDKDGTGIDQFVLVKLASTGEVLVIASTDTVQAALGGPTSGSGAQFDPEDFAIGPDGTLYIFDERSSAFGPERVIAIADPLGTPVITELVNGDDIEALSAITTFSGDSGITISLDGTKIYVPSEAEPQGIIEIDIATGTPSLLTPADGGPFNDIDGFIGIAPNGDILVADAGADETVWRVDKVTGEVTVFLSNGDLESAAGGDVDLEGGFAFNADGNFYLTDQDTDDILFFPALDPATGAVDGSAGRVFASQESMEQALFDFNGRVADVELGSGLTITNIVAPAPGSGGSIDFEPDTGSEITTLTSEDDETTLVDLSFAFPFLGGSFSTIGISTNGVITLTDNLSDASLFPSPDESDLLGASVPVISPFWSDLDLTEMGTVRINDFGDRVALTWDRVGSFEDGLIPFTFQAQLFADGKIAFSYNGISDLSRLGDNDLVIGLSPGMASDPGESDFAAGAFSTLTGAVYEVFRQNSESFDLDGQTIVFRPSGDGWAIVPGSEFVDMGPAFGPGFFYEFQVGEAEIVLDNVHGTDLEDGVTTQFTITSLPLDQDGNPAGLLLIDRGDDGVVDEIVGGSFGAVPVNVQTGDSVFYYLPFDSIEVKPEQVTFNYFTTDSDALVSDGAIVTIGFPDSEPVIVSADPAIVDEDDLPSESVEGGPPITVAALIAVPSGDEGQAPGTDVVDGISDGTPPFDPTTVTGTIAVNFEFDRPGTLTFTDATKTALEAEDLTSTTVKSLTFPDGVPLVYEIVDGGRTLLSSAGEDGPLVFQIALSPATSDGEFSYELSLFGSINHPFGDNTDAPRVLPISFLATDADGDMANGAFTVTLTDDLPVITIDGGEFFGNPFPNPCAPSSVDSESDLKIWEQETNGGEAIRSTSLTIAFGADGPAAVFDGGEGGSEVSPIGFELVGAMALAEGPGDPSADPEIVFDLDGTSSGPRLTSGGEIVHIETDPSNPFRILGVIGGDMSPGRIIYDLSGATLVFTATLDTGLFSRTPGTERAEFTFELLQPLDHPDTGEVMDADQIQFSFQVSATDDDGDVATQILTVSVDDDGPRVTGEPVMGVVEEEEFTNGIEDTTANPDLDLDVDGGELGFINNTTATDSGNISVLVNFGADGPGGFSLSSDTSGLPALTSRGETISYVVDGDRLTGYVDTGDTAGELDLGDRAVFVFDLLESGDYTFRLLDILDHPNPGEDNLAIDLSSIIQASDNDGDTITLDEGTFSIKVIDDVPVALNDTNMVVEGGGSTIGNVLSAPGEDDFGADGPGGIVSVSNGTATLTIADATTGGDVTLNGPFGGTLVLNLLSGAYIYTPPASVNNSGGNPSDEFTYTIVDADGDTDSATLSIEIKDTAPVARADLDMVVEGAESATTGNVLTGLDTDLAPNDGMLLSDIPSQDAGLTIQSVASDLVVKTAADVDLAGNVSLTSTLGGTLVINLASGAYSYAPPASVDNSSGNPLDVFNYTIVDGDGSTSSTTLSIEIKPTAIDNLPTANPVTVTHDETPGDDGDDDINPASRSSALNTALLAVFGAATVDLLPAEIGVAAKLFTFNYGLDGKGATGGIALDAVTTDTDSTLVDVLTGAQILLNTGPDGTVVGTVAGSGEVALVAFLEQVGGETGALNAAGALMSFVQYRAVEHDNPSDPDEANNAAGAEPAPFQDEFVDLSYTVTDSNGSTATATATVTVEDDGPSIAAPNFTLVNDETFGLGDDTPSDDIDLEPILTGGEPPALGDLFGLVGGAPINVSGKPVTFKYGADGRGELGGIALKDVVNGADSGLIHNETGRGILLFNGPNHSVFGLVPPDGVDPAAWAATIDPIGNPGGIAGLDVAFFSVLLETGTPNGAANGNESTAVLFFAQYDSIQHDNPFDPDEVGPESSGGAATADLAVIDFESFSAGDIVSSISTIHGVVTVEGINPNFPANPNEAMIFDSTNPTGGDTDLGTPNADFGGPGIGSGGSASGSFPNDTALGNVLIISTDLNSANPNDATAVGSNLKFDFSAIGPVAVESLTIIDVDQNEVPPLVDMFDIDGKLIASFLLPSVGNNGVETVTFPDVTGVVRMEVVLNGSGAIDNIAFRPADAFVDEFLNLGYTVTDADLDTAMGTARITIEDDGPMAVNDAPVYLSLGGIDGGDVTGNDVFGVDGSALTPGGPISSFTFVGDDGFGTPITLTAAAGATVTTFTGGDLTVQANGVWSYEAPASISDGALNALGLGPGALGFSDSFSYLTHDGDGDADRAIQPIRIATGPATLGGSGAETLDGTDAADFISGGGGNDTINGMGGNDLLFGDGSDDTLIGGVGDDTLTGDNGVDTFVYSLAVNEGTDEITDFQAGDMLSFTDVVDTGAPAGTDIADVLTSFSKVGSTVTLGLASGTTVMIQDLDSVLNNQDDVAAHSLINGA